MGTFIVTKDILNIRSRPSADSDDTFIGSIKKGQTIFLDEKEIIGTVPVGGTSNIWLRDNYNRFVNKEGVVAGSQFWISEYGIDQLWQDTKGENVTVIIIDSGVKDCDDISSDKISKTAVLGDNAETDTVGHGTLMASIIAGKGVFIQGVAPHVNIASVKITETELFNDNNFIAALRTLPDILKKDQFYVINCSLNLKYDLEEEIRTEVQEILDELYSKYHLIFTAAVGNNGKKEDTKPVPASLNKIISCAAFRISGSEVIRLSDSNYWSDITITAPGEFPASQIDGHLSPQGSSQACAFTTGLIALFVSKSIKQGKLPGHDEVMGMIKNCTVKIDSDILYNLLDKKSMIETFNKI